MTKEEIRDRKALTRAAILEVSKGCNDDTVPFASAVFSELGRLASEPQTVDELRKYVLVILSNDTALRMMCAAACIGGMQCRIADAERKAS